MSTSATHLLDQALQLPVAECEELYLRLADHLFSPESFSEDHKREWEQRWSGIRDGGVATRNAFEVLQEVRAKYGV